jgi:regulator of replication initiation timing
MWAHPDHQKVVSKCVLELANPIDQEANELLDRIEVLDDQLSKAVQEGDNTKAVAKHAVEIHHKLTLAKKQMDDLEKRVQESGKKSEIFGSLKSRFEATTAKLMKEGFGIDKI